MCYYNAGDENTYIDYEVTVRRVMITEGLWSSRSSREVAALREQGLSIQEIAAAMSVSVKAVEAYMPYSRGMYGENATEDAKHSREYRDRVSDAQDKMRTLAGDNGEGKIRTDDEPIEACPEESSDEPEQAVEPVPIIKSIAAILYGAIAAYLYFILVITILGRPAEDIPQTELVPAGGGDRECDQEKG